MKENRKIRWGILGLGRISRSFVRDLQFSDGSVLYAVGSRSDEKAEAFKNEFQASKAYGDYRKLLEDPEVDVVYISTPHSLHYELTMACLDHGKAVLCEKPLAMNAAQVEQIIEKQRETGLFAMEALWTRFIPAYRAARKWIAEETNGVISMNADFAFPSEYGPKHRLHDPHLGGGSLLDIGIYPVFLALDLMGRPESLQATGLIENGIDIRMSALFGYPEGGSAMLYSDIDSETRMDAVIRTDKGTLILPERWHNLDHFFLKKGNHTTRYEYPRVGKGYYHEIRHVEECLQKGLSQSPLYPLSQSLILISHLDVIREHLKLKYPEDIEKI